MTFEKYVTECQRRQRKYIEDETRRMAKAYKLFRKYKTAMCRLGLHPLTENEIQARGAELLHMTVKIPETHSAERLRPIYEMHTR